VDGGSGGTHRLGDSAEDVGVPGEDAVVEASRDHHQMRVHNIAGCASREELAECSAVVERVMAELAAGPHAARTADERGRRQDRLQRAEAAFDPVAFDSDEARAYGSVYAVVTSAGGRARGARAGTSSSRQRRAPLTMGSPGWRGEVV